MAEKEKMIVNKLLTEDQLGHNNLFARVTIFPHETLEFHEHHGETETYHIIAGEGDYNDNGKIIHVKPGDTLFCKDGDGHGITNTEDTDLEFIALIIQS